LDDYKQASTERGEGSGEETAVKVETRSGGGGKNDLLPRKRSWKKRNEKYNC
jgi:hypothetical protein